MNSVLTSPTNDDIKHLKKLLRDKTTRDITRSFVVENLVIITDAFQAGIRPTTLYLTDARRAHPDIAKILRKLPEVITITERVNEVFSTLKTPPGIAAIYDKPRDEPDYAKTTIYCNGISDPGNLGTILRTAAAFGIANVITDETCADIYNAKTLQAAKDAIFKLNTATDKGGKIFARLKQHMPIIATVTDGTPLSELNLSGFSHRMCLVLGSESHGIAAPLLKAATTTIAIPLTGDIESLNVAVACGIVLYALSRPAA